MYALCCCQFEDTSQSCLKILCSCVGNNNMAFALTCEAKATQAAFFRHRNYIALYAFENMQFFCDFFE